MYTAKDIAKYIVNKCIEDNRPVSNLQLQKILYFCQREYERTTGLTLFNDDFEAWPYGPVVPSVYKTFSLFGGMKINRKIKMDASIDPETCNVIDPIIEECSSYAAWDLVSKTHRCGGAWDQVFQNGKGNRSTIAKELIFAYDAHSHDI